ncbi:nitroreductase/quinone reductase family protein [Nocardia sp. NPDC051832]|uniref:nitroreductase/quinone reductase family protein n=1 Tax=Nocardia sp. NPDC051832 TaxID=3155673 RepID=UPI00341688E8
MGIAEFRLAAQSSSEIQLTVRSRRTGRATDRPVGFVEERGALYLLPIHGSDSSWYRNVLATPRVRLAVPGVAAAVVDSGATAVTDPGSVAAIVEKFHTKYGRAEVEANSTKLDVAVEVRLNPGRQQRIRRLSSAGGEAWEGLEGGRMSLRNAVDDARDGQLTAGFTRLDKGATFDFAFAYDEILVVTKGAITWQIGGESRTQGVGDLAFYPTGAAAVGRADEDTEAVYVLYPPYWQFTDPAWQLAESDPGAPDVRVFDSADQKLEQVGDLGYFSAVVLDDPGAAMSAKLERVRAGVSGEHHFPYDEVHIVISGMLSVHTSGETVTARAGEVLYLPMGAQGVTSAEEDVEMVSVTYPPLWLIRTVR